ncbi:activator of HSP90 ATPase [Nocardioides szechwanensis]|uniref:Uncharacterized conserved protein YndB, AHSA1/START domain n=1 Tax=Nocardioides szechwanensis TaxID=1005944 RepID=A0A1H0BM43_9ACTN|nr:SRPBCC family protein [Nocardioides szechwanensis]GEP36142.1 activator of HSP90 ATPase [Nocardioides szechwanensis]SDN46757.1 Uncharacterized conserved protein YndB, AHSA1/START domain [Nocardioides szechwanensis]
MSATTGSTTTKQTTIEADPEVPTITMTREFDAPPERVFQAWVDPELFVQWIGPRSIDTRIEHWDARTGGSWSYTAEREDLHETFFGSFHEVRSPERLVQTFTWGGEPDSVSLETLRFEPLEGGRTRIVGVSVVESMELRDLILSSGMEVGVNEGYEKLDELLARG